MSGIIKTIKAKDDNNIEQNIFPKTVLEAVVKPETNETLDNILDDLDNRKINTTDIVDNLLSNRADLPVSANQVRKIKEFLDIKIGSVVWESDTYKPDAGLVASVRQSGNIVHLYIIGGYSTGTKDLSGNNFKMATIQGVDYPPYLIRSHCMATSGEIYNAQGASLGIASITEDGGLYFSGISTTRNIIINITYLVENS